MSIYTKVAVQASPSGVKDTPENVSFRESPTAEQHQNPRIVEVEFSPPVTRFRTSIPPRKPRNAERRSRDFLTPAEVESVMKAAEGVGRHGHRDATIIMIGYRHALRVSELISLRWDQVDLSQGLLHVRRAKNGN